VTGVVPPGDPGELRLAAARFSSLAEVHAGQQREFRDCVQAALAGWSGGVAEQYAVAAGQASGRFTAVCEALAEASRALGAYASELEHAQQVTGTADSEMTLLAAVPGRYHDEAGYISSESALGQREQAALDDLEAAAATCARALDGAAAALRMSCPDTMTAARLLAYIRQASAAAAVSSSGATILGDVLSAGGLVFMAERGITAAGRQRRLAEDIASVLSKEKYIQATMRDLMRMGADNPALRNWIGYSVSLLGPAMKSRAESEAAVAAKGGTLWSALEKSAEIGFRDDKTAEEVAAEVARSAGTWDKFVTAAKLTERFSAACAVANIGLGIYTMVDPNHSSGWMDGADFAGGAASTAGGIGQVMLWSDSTMLSDALIGTTFAELIPGLNVITTAALAGAALWTTGELAAHEIDQHWHAIAHGADAARHEAAHGFDATRHEAAHLLDDLNPF
jgi:uncharacterized protein YukE